MWWPRLLELCLKPQEACSSIQKIRPSRFEHHWWLSGWAFWKWRHRICRDKENHQSVLSSSMQGDRARLERVWSRIFDHFHLWGVSEFSLDWTIQWRRYFETSMLRTYVHHSKVSCLWLPRHLNKQGPLIAWAQIFRKHNRLSWGQSCVEAVDLSVPWPCYILTLDLLIAPFMY